MPKSEGKHKCPVCGKYEFDAPNSFDLCPECGWEDSGLQEDEPDYEVAPNFMSLNQYREKYESGWKPEWLLES